MATARQDIQLGVEPKGVGGHNNRQAHVICNAQFTELYKAMGAVFGGVNSGAEGAVLPQFLPIEKGGTGGGTVEEARLNLNVYSKEEVDTAISSSVPVVVDATTTDKGVVELATQTEVNTGTDAVRAVTPQTMLSGVKNHLNASGSAPLFACRAWVNFNGVPLNGTYSQSGTTVTVTMTAHGMSVGKTVDLAITSGTAVSGRYTVATVADANTFTYTAGTSLTTSGNVTRNNFIRASGNVLGITDNGVGLYTVNFNTAMPHTNYAVLTTVSPDHSGTNTTTYTANLAFGYTPTTAGFQVATKFSVNGVSPTLIDIPHIHIGVLC